MKHLHLHVESDRATAIDLADLTQCKYCYKAQLPRYSSFTLKETVSRDVRIKVFSYISFPQAPEYRYAISAVSNCLGNSRRYSQLKVQHCKCKNLT
jgi:hypothetical protein